IALLLPLTGQAKVLGNPIMQGFTDAKEGLTQANAAPDAPQQDSLASILAELGISSPNADTATTANDNSTEDTTAEGAENS
ncbi:penicillin-binding protein activator LpoA, partial [Proteus mirabilis]|nr:penicillin-binding protein activator LpoA [Proteus mirabilis]